MNAVVIAVQIVPVGNVVAVVVAGLADGLSRQSGGDPGDQSVVRYGVVYIGGIQAAVVVGIFEGGVSGFVHIVQAVVVAVQIVVVGQTVAVGIQRQVVGYGIQIVRIGSQRIKESVLSESSRLSVDHAVAVQVGHKVFGFAQIGDAVVVAVQVEVIGDVVAIGIVHGRGAVANAVVVGIGTIVLQGGIAGVLII